MLGITVFLAQCNRWVVPTPFSKPQSHYFPKFGECHYTEMTLHSRLTVL